MGELKDLKNTIQAQENSAEQGGDFSPRSYTGSEQFLSKFHRVLVDKIILKFLRKD